MKCQAKDMCDGKGEATHECINCGVKYCGACANEIDFDCGCKICLSIFPIKKEGEKDGKK